jgi:hypothetical protein
VARLSSFSTPAIFRPVLSDPTHMLEHMYEDGVAVRDRLAEMVDRLEPDLLTASAARELWHVLDSAERLCAAGKTLLASRIAATHQASNGTRSAVEELARSAGSGIGQAKDSIETSKRLPNQAALNAALRRGELSTQQAAAISAAAEADPSQADRLVQAAGELSLPELRDECARVRAAADPDPDATNRRLHEKRCLRRYTDAEGSWNLHAKGTPQAGAAINAVLDTLTDQLFQQARRDGRREPYEAYAFDALLTMSDHAATNAAPRGADGSTDAMAALTAEMPPVRHGAANRTPVRTTTAKATPVRRGAANPTATALPAAACGSVNRAPCGTRRWTAPIRNRPRLRTASTVTMAPPRLAMLLISCPPIGWSRSRGVVCRNAIWRCCALMWRRCAAASSQPTSCARSEVSDPSQFESPRGYWAGPS